jgi:hypothetical protein
MLTRVTLSKSKIELLMRRECDCFEPHKQLDAASLRFHGEQQDTECAAWKRLLALVEEAASDGREEFAPINEMTIEESAQIVTLPSTIAKLKSVKHLSLYGTFLARIPPEIGGMASLEEFVPYTSHRLHWFPYEITRCTRLKESTVSTRSLYGNWKYRPSFPPLTMQRSSTAGLDLANLPPATTGATSIRTCSVCDALLAGTGLYQAWLSLNVATDVLPLLVNACSLDCIAMLPRAADNYVPTAHTGGPDVQQPPARYADG